MPPPTPANERKAEPFREVTLGHKNDGGTGVTNFDKKDAPIYREAIRLHGDPAMVVSERDFMEDGYTRHFSLHDLDPDRAPSGDLSPFWTVFDLVAALYERRKLFGVEHTGAAEWVRYRNSYASLRQSNEEMRKALEEMARLATHEGWNTVIFESEFGAAVRQARSALARAQALQTATSA